MILIVIFKIIFREVELELLVIFWFVVIFGGVNICKKKKYLFLRWYSKIRKLGKKKL